jgi:hypothetical protein
MFRDVFGWWIYSDMKLRSYIGGLALFSKCIEMVRSSVVCCDFGESRCELLFL